MQKETEDRLRATIIKPTREAFKVEMDIGEINAGFIFGVIALYFKAMCGFSCRDVVSEMFEHF